MAESNSPTPTEEAKPKKKPSLMGEAWETSGPVGKVSMVSNVGFTAWMLASMLGDIWGVLKNHQANKLKKQQEMQQMAQGGPMMGGGMAPPTVQQMGFQQPQGPGGF